MSTSCSDATSSSDSSNSTDSTSTISSFTKTVLSESEHALRSAESICPGRHPEAVPNFIPCARPGRRTQRRHRSFSELRRGRDGQLCVFGPEGKQACANPLCPFCYPVLSKNKILQANTRPPLLRLFSRMSAASQLTELAQKGEQCRRCFQRLPRKFIGKDTPCVFALSHAQRFRCMFCDRGQLSACFQKRKGAALIVKAISQMHHASQHLVSDTRTPSEDSIKVGCLLSTDVWHNTIDWNEALQHGRSPYAGASAEDLPQYIEQRY